MLDWSPQPPYTAEQLLQVIRILRDPENGCPWDKVQTHASIRKNFPVSYTHLTLPTIA